MSSGGGVSVTCSVDWIWVRSNRPSGVSLHQARAVERKSIVSWLVIVSVPRVSGLVLMGVNEVGGDFIN